AWKRSKLKTSARGTVGCPVTTSGISLTFTPPPDAVLYDSFASLRSRSSTVCRDAAGAHAAAAAPAAAMANRRRVITSASSSADVDALRVGAAELDPIDDLPRAELDDDDGMLLGQHHVREPARAVDDALPGERAEVQPLDLGVRLRIDDREHALAPVADERVLAVRAEARGVGALAGREALEHLERDKIEDRVRVRAVFHDPDRLLV